MRKFLSVHERTCNICKSNETEDEIHFLFKCLCYYDLRHSLINKQKQTFCCSMMLKKHRHVVEYHFIYVLKIIVDYSIIETIHLLPALYINMHIFKVFESECKCTCKIIYDTDILH